MTALFAILVCALIVAGCAIAWERFRFARQAIRLNRAETDRVIREYKDTPDGRRSDSLPADRYAQSH